MNVLRLHTALQAMPAFAKVVIGLDISEYASTDFTVEERLGTDGEKYVVLNVFKRSDSIQLV